MLNIKHVSGVLLAGVLSAVSAGAYAEVVVVVSTKSSAPNLTADQVSDIFLGKMNALPGGATVVPFDQGDGATRDDFYHKTTGKTAAQVKAYWSKQIFSGKGQPPKDLGDSAGIKSQLASNPNAIGYLDKSALDATVKVLLTLK